MKKLTVFLFAAVLIAGTVSAQTRNHRPFSDRQPPERPVLDSTTIEGTLKLERGMIALESGDSVFFVPVLNRYIGFIDGLKEGANVSVEGRLHRNIIFPSKVTIAGKPYDLAADRPAFGARHENFGNRRNSDERVRSQAPGNFGHGHGRNNFGPNPDRRNFSPNRKFHHGCICIAAAH